MKEFVVSISHTLSKCYVVEAKTKEEAIAKAQEFSDNNSLSYDDFVWEEIQEETNQWTDENNSLELCEDFDRIK